MARQSRLWPFLDGVRQLAIGLRRPPCYACLDFRIRECRTQARNYLSSVKSMR